VQIHLTSQKQFISKMKNIILLILFFSFVSGFAQKLPFREEIETDSSNIEIIRNSIYRVYTETYKRCDSIWWNVTFIDDTTKLVIEGWRLKNGSRLGIWKEFDIKGNLLYTIDYENQTSEVNPKFFPYHYVLEKAKLKADSMICETYSREFLEKHMKFNFHCYAYSKYKKRSKNKGIWEWEEESVGSWTEPMTKKPNLFILEYEVRLNPKDSKFVLIRLKLDENGNFVPTGDDYFNNYGFEQLTTEDRCFLLNEEKAMEVVKQNGLVVTDSSKIYSFLFWENFKKKQFYDGQFRYYIIEFVKQIEYKASEERKGIVNKYIVYSFNPWTAEFIEKKKMRTKHEWEKSSGYSTGLVPDEE